MLLFNFSSSFCSKSQSVEESSLLSCHPEGILWTFASYRELYSQLGLFNKHFLTGIGHVVKLIFNLIYKRRLLCNTGSQEIKFLMLVLL